jgi:hypothetical protein
MRGLRRREATVAEDAALRPMILIRGFCGSDVAGEQGNLYQGDNDGPGYPERLHLRRVPASRPEIRPVALHRRHERGGRLPRGIAAPRRLLERLPPGWRKPRTSSPPSIPQYRVPQGRRRFPVERIFTVAGTNYRTYNTSVASLMNRKSSLLVNYAGFAQMVAYLNGLTPLDPRWSRKPSVAAVGQSAQVATVRNAGYHFSCTGGCSRA